MRPRESAVSYKSRVLTFYSIPPLSPLLLSPSGCFTTVSTFVNELRLLPLPLAYRYGAASVFVTQAALLVLLGAFFGGDPSVRAPIEGG